jgi:hypothetical protein
VTALRIVGLDALYLGVGLTLLAAFGLVASVRDAARLAGLAFLAGWAAVGIGTVYLLLAGAAGTVDQVVALAAAVAAAAVAAARAGPVQRRVGGAAGPTASRGRPTPESLALAGAAALLIAIVFAELFRSLRHVQPAQWDAWAFWVPKAEAVVYGGGIHMGAGSLESFANPDYPPLTPVLDATTFRFAGRVDPGLLPLQHWFVALAMFAALAGLLWRHVHPAALLGCLAAFALLPSYQHEVGSLLGDETLIAAVALTAAAAGLWLVRRDPRYLALYALFGSALALAKNEGYSDVVVMSAILVAVSIRRRPRLPLLLVAVPVLAMQPWKRWSSAHHVPKSDYYDFANLLHPGYLSARFDRLTYTLHALPQYYLAVDRWLVLLPVAAVLVGLAARRRPALALFVVGTVVVAFAGNVVVYWISPSPVAWYVSTSGSRTADGPLVLVAALLPLLLAEAMAAARPAGWGDRLPAPQPAD